MEIIVENFGKIKSARINLEDYTIFIGNNNSGKTYLMQLIYGLLIELKNIYGAKNTLFKSLPFRADSTNVKKIVDCVNEWLKKNKNEIVKTIFSESLEIGKIEIQIDPYKYESYCSELKILEKKEIDENVFSFKEEYKESKGPFLCLVNREGEIIILDDDFSMRRDKPRAWDFFISCVMDDLLSTELGSDCLYLPASRSGLNLVYKEILAGQASYRFSEMDLRNRMNPQKLGLTRPVFDYMLFLQKYRFDSDASMSNRSEIDFINKKIIKGEISNKGNGIRYKTDTGKDLPLHLSSSMVNELSPIIHLLTSSNDVGFVFYDEVETCQHPTTQLLLARLLNRLVNVGYKLIISTHSDTMAAAINNILYLSRMKNEKKVMKSRHYESSDLLKNRNFHAYQFVSKNGLTKVEEVPWQGGVGLGFDFTLFNKSNEILVDDYNAMREV